MSHYKQILPGYQKKKKKKERKEAQLPNERRVDIVQHHFRSMIRLI